MIKFLKKYENKSFEDLVNGIIWQDLPFRLKAIFSSLKASIDALSGQTGELPYRVYTALLTQSGTDAPVATVLENTLGGNPTWSYDSTGYYYLNGAGLFDGNIAVIGGLGATADHYLLSFVNDYSADSVNIFVSPLNNIAAGGNDLLADTFVEIRVYDN